MVGKRSTDLFLTLMTIFTSVAHKLMYFSTISVHARPPRRTNFLTNETHLKQSEHRKQCFLNFSIIEEKFKYQGVLNSALDLLSCKQLHCPWFLQS